MPRNYGLTWNESKKIYDYQKKKGTKKAARASVSLIHRKLSAQSVRDVVKRHTEYKKK